MPNSPATFAQVSGNDWERMKTSATGTTKRITLPPRPKADPWWPWRSDTFRTLKGVAGECEELFTNIAILCEKLALPFPF